MDDRQSGLTTTLDIETSGIGRENGTAGMDSWSQIKSVYVDMSERVDCPYLR